MATITKTGKETEASYSSGTFYASTWTLEYTCPNIIVSSNDVAVAVNPSLTAKYVGTNKGNGSCQVAFFLFANNILLQWGNDGTGSRFKYTTFNRNYGAMTSGTKYSIAIPSYEYSSIKLTTEELTSIFGDSTTRTIDIVAKTNINVGSANTDGWSNIGTWETSDASFFNPDTSVTLGTIATLTLDAPPQVTHETPTYSTPYAGIGIYTIPLTSLQAQYGSKIVSVTLTIGPDSITQTYSASEVIDQTISVIPSIAETYNPILTVTDSRGQTKTEILPQITVNSYNIPSVSFDVYRTNNNGAKTDEGSYAIIDAQTTYTTEATSLVKPDVTIDGINMSSNVTWYSTWVPSEGVSGSAINDWSSIASNSHIYGLINGNFSETTSYQITVTAKDDLNGKSSPITQTLSTAFYTIDFQAGGKEIAFGAPANDNLTNVNGNDYSENGLFKCRMHTLFEQNVNTNGNITCVNVIASNLIGEIKQYAGATVPTGWLECDGSEVAVADYPLLYAAIGNLWGTPSDANHFILPNFKGKVPVGYDSSQTEFDTVGESGGTKTVTLKTTEIPSHSHAYQKPVLMYGQGGNMNWGTATATNAKGSDQWGYSGVGNTGGGGAHNNMQPYAVVKYIICAA